MTETFYKKGIFKASHTTFSGELTLYDFEGHHTLTSFANKIAKEQSFDRQCKKNIEFRNRTRKVRTTALIAAMNCLKSKD